jgi:hypothetical protein
MWAKIIRLLGGSLTALRKALRFTLERQEGSFKIWAHFDSWICAGVPIFPRVRGKGAFYEYFHIQLIVDRFRRERFSEYSARAKNPAADQQLRGHDQVVGIATGLSTLQPGPDGLANRFQSQLAC